MSKIKLCSYSEEEWQKFISGRTYSIFQEPVWINIVAAGYKADPLYFVLQREGEEVSGIAGNLLNLGVMKMFFSTYPYGGVIGVPEFSGIFSEYLVKELKSRGIHRVHFTRPAWSKDQGFHGYRRSSSYIHILDVRGKTLETLWDGYKKRVRRDVIRAKKSGIKVDRIKDRKEIETYYEIYLDTMKRNGSIATHSKELYMAIYDKLITTGKATILFAKHGKEYAGGVTLLFSKDTVYLLGNVSLDSYLPLCLNDLLIHSSIELGITMGAKSFDFMTSSGDDVSLMNFKKKWGSDKREFNTFEKDISFLRPKIWDFFWNIANFGLLKKAFSYVYNNNFTAGR